MDDQHGILMDTMNDLRLALVRGSGHQQINSQLEQLIEFTRKHFQSEEHLLEQHGFPGLPEHRAAHERLLGQVREAVNRAEHSEDLEIQPLLGFLRTWYLDHIETVDRQYGPWLNARGVY
jgi:hemerythrin-like metal-binding protein